jgi:TDG/mug DNA glycosylase family protein
MKHATPAALDRIEPLLGEIRRCEGLVEHERGLFSRGPRAFLHFHEDPAGMFADLRSGAGFARMRVSTAGERRAFLRALQKALASATGATPAHRARRPAAKRARREPMRRGRPVLEDRLAVDLALVVCGFAAGAESARRGHYYAGPGNKLWRTLHETGLTPRLLAPAEYRELLSFGIGLTDVVKDQSGSDAEVDLTGFDPRALRAKIRRYAPRWLCFNSKNAAKTFLGRPVDYGLQPETIGDTRLFVAPSTSGRASGSWDAAWWHDLARRVRAAP